MIYVFENITLTAVCRIDCRGQEWKLGGYWRHASGRGGGGWGGAGAEKMGRGGQDGFQREEERARGDGGATCC